MTDSNDGAGNVRDPDVGSIRKEEIRSFCRKLANIEDEVADTDLVYFACLIGDPDCIIELSNYLLEQLEQYKNIRREAVERQKIDPTRTSVSPVWGKGAIPPSTVKALAYFMLERSVRLGHPPPDELVQLFYSSLEIENWRGKKEVQKERERFTVAEYLARNPNAGPRDVARATGIGSSTVSDWMKDKKFDLVSEMTLGIMRFRAVSRDQLDIVRPQRKRSVRIKRLK